MKNPMLGAIAILLAVLVDTPAALSATDAGAYYPFADFEHVPKFDAHVHANSDAGQFLNIAQRDGFELLSINVDYPDFPSLARQADIAHRLHASSPSRFHFATTFSMQGFGESGWTDATVRHIDAEIARGALAVKVWKNIGMVEKDARSRYILLDDPGFDGVMRHLEEHNTVLIAHQAEPKNCWLPLDEMTTENDRSYFRDHPDYYMYRHPDRASYESLMAVRDHFVAQHPHLKFVGAHLASLEWNVARIAKFLDAYPNATVDLAARMSQVQYQSRTHWQRVRHFFIRYQDRILYGSDLTEEADTVGGAAQNPPMDSAQFVTEAEALWRSDFRYLATPETQRIDALKANVRGLALPRGVIDKIYFANARRVFILP